MVTEYQPWYFQEILEGTALGVGIAHHNWERFEDALMPLRLHHFPTFLHSMRVGWYTCHMAQDLTLPIDWKLCLFGGCGHDVGKCMISVETIEANPYLPEHNAEMQNHPVYGYQMLASQFLGTALVAGLHHTFKENGYGLVDEDISDSKYIMLVARAVKVAKVVAVADFFDALTTRKNDKGFITDLNDKDQIREVFLKHNPGKEEMLEWLLEHQVKIAGV